MNPFTKAGALAVVLSNDFWYMHLYSKDEDFDKSHELTGNYYNRLVYEADELFELAVQEGFDIVNPNVAASLFPDYVIETGTEYSYFEVVQKARDKLNLYITNLRAARDATMKTDIQSKIDSLLEYWDKEVNYKLARRSPIPSMLNGFVNSGFDNALAYVIGGR